MLNDGVLILRKLFTVPRISRVLIRWTMFLSRLCSFVRDTVALFRFHVGNGWEYLASTVRDEKRRDYKMLVRL